MTRRLIGTFLATIALTFGLIGGMGIVNAQDATPDPNEAAPHPAHIHSGTCEELGDVVFPLEDVSGEALEGTPEASPVPVGESGASEVIARSESTVDASLDDILAEEHAVNVHESAENIGVYIACGNIEGEPEDGTLIIDLEQQNDSGVEGQAVLAETDEGTVDVTITLVNAEGETTATPSS